MSKDGGQGSDDTTSEFQPTRRGQESVTSIISRLLLSGSTRLYLQNYVTSDSADKVLSFYRKQLSKYGTVLQCRNGKPVAAVPSQLKCDSDKDFNSIELKAGSEEKQHMVGVTPTAGGAQFEVVYLDETPRSKR